MINNIAHFPSCPTFSRSRLFLPPPPLAAGQTTLSLLAPRVGGTEMKTQRYEISERTQELAHEFLGYAEVGKLLLLC
jgi:hypothetical protein